MQRDYSVRRERAIHKTGFFEKVFLQQKLDNLYGYILFGLIAGLFGYLIAMQTPVGLQVLAGFIGLFVVFLCLMSSEIGLFIIMFCGFFSFFINRLLFHEDFPIGIVSDVLILVTFLGLFIGKKGFDKDFREMMSSSIVIAIFLYTFYILVELFNPYAHSFDGWFQTFRRFAVCVFLLFIAYNVFKRPGAIRRYVIFLFILAFVSGLYGCIQQWYGFFGFENDLIFNSGKKIIYINGNELRKFSTMSDPLSYGANMAGCAIFFLILATNQKKIFYSLVLIGGTIFMLLGMAYSGTRTANIMVLAGIVMFVMLTFNKRSTRIFAFFSLVVFLFLLYAPIYSNGTLNRFRTSFMGKQDASYNVREINRKAIQPYIYSHPIGGGMCTTGDPGLRFNPGHELAGFPPDSSYLRKALETGWIGLIFVFILYFITLKSGLRGYFTTRHDKHKVLFAASIAFLFAFYIAEFPQEALGQITDMVIYYPIIAMIIKLKYIDNKTRVQAGEEEVTV